MTSLSPTGIRGPSCVYFFPAYPGTQYDPPSPYTQRTPVRYPLPSLDFKLGGSTRPHNGSTCDVRAVYSPTHILSRSLVAPKSVPPPPRPEPKRRPFFSFANTVEGKDAEQREYARREYMQKQYDAVRACDEYKAYQVFRVPVGPEPAQQPENEESGTSVVAMLGSSAVTLRLNDPHAKLVPGVQALSWTVLRCVLGLLQALLASTLLWGLTATHAAGTFLEASSAITGAERALGVGKLNIKGVVCVVVLALAWTQDRLLKMFGRLWTARTFWLYTFIGVLATSWLLEKTLGAQPGVVPVTRGLFESRPYRTSVF
ncbi:hypothetical protein BU23DRAFT_634500 [Bimuria novae-zelandiae CBS 107.79]|uniref:Uncharacterized protein n=1 Tax=Bimuria novae-zelandiae CBS 107.79 TaxID=1447943 RepID=A0A6A5VK06_9PLEO|nr:hypothetical protein BU23DRAFT_634500 [Bimuria novae-zelandiae CBS 107.79]